MPVDSFCQTGYVFSFKSSFYERNKSHMEGNNAHD